MAVKEIKARMLNWASQFSILLFLDSNEYPRAGEGYEGLLACGTMGGEIRVDDTGDGLAGVQKLHDKLHDWLFGHISYDYKNTLEPKLHSSHSAEHGFPHLYFFIPRTVCYINKECSELTIETFDDPRDVYNSILQTPVRKAGQLPKVTFTVPIDKTGYIDAVNRLRNHIADGDCYEINFCNKGFCEDVVLEPVDTFTALSAISPAPFSAYYRMQDKYMMCASPERYIHKKGDKLICQPIKGTARRDGDAAKDAMIREELRANLKERAENVMIVDLVRNDLARCCKIGSVHVDELYGIYSFPQVHQMISTVSGTLRQSASFTDALRYTFPMGSMTGAPKFKVMQLIDQYEQVRRELFSGSVGYITPDGDFDFNVIIRSLFYDETSKYLSYQTGGAITYDSNPEQEWEEMRLKAWALERIFA